MQAINLIPGSAFANDNTLRVNGMPANTQSIRIEGQDATNGQHREFNQATQASLDAIQEVTVQVSNYAAEYGQAGGGYFNYTMKSGSNAFHGSAYDYFVNEVLNAGRPFTDAGLSNSLKTGQHIRDAQRRNNYGFTFGGPIVIPKLYNGHDKTFFFFNFEQFRESQVVASGLTTVPTLAYRQGDFSAAQIGPLTIAGQPAIDALGRPLIQNTIYDPDHYQNGAGWLLRARSVSGKRDSDRPHGSSGRQNPVIYSSAEELRTRQQLPYPRLLPTIGTPPFLPSSWITMSVRP